jgi:hypothetical protein
MPGHLENAAENLTISGMPIIIYLSQNADVFQPRLSVWPAGTVALGSVDVGKTLDADVYTIRNIALGTLTGTVSVSAPFSILSGGSFRLAPGQSQVVRMRFAPTKAMTYTSNVPFITNANGTTGVVTATGTWPRGDVNHDGKVNSADAILILRYAAGVSLPAGITHNSTWDLNGDGKTDSGDAVIALRLAVGLPAAAATSVSTRLPAQSTPVTVSLGAPRRVSVSTWLVPVVVSPEQGVCAGDVTITYDLWRVRSASGETRTSTGNFLLVQNPQYGKLKVSLAGSKPLTGTSGQALLNLRVVSRYASWWSPMWVGVRLNGIRLYDQSGRPLSVRLGTVTR